MTLKQNVQRGIALALITLITVSVLFLGNQHPAQANISAGEIICFVFSSLNAEGSPLPVLHSDECQNPPLDPPQCTDAIDNDGDGLTDFPNDPGCTSATDNNEFDVPPVPLPACMDGIDNDLDGATDWPADTGCANIADTVEGDAPDVPPENTLLLCSDTLDNDTDGNTDLDDSDCAAFRPALVVVKRVINDNNGSSVAADFSLFFRTATATTTVTSGATSTVAVGTYTVGEMPNAGYTATFAGDCDASGAVELAPGQTKTCMIINNDVAPTLPAACADGVDNDTDGAIDLADSDCESATDTDESTSPGGGSNPAAPPPAGGGSSSGGGGGSPSPAVSSSGGGGGGAVLGASKEALQALASCDTYLTAFIRSGKTNDQDQVRRLQKFLRDSEGANVEETGAYDAGTLAAVHIFQTKYASEILTPWGIGKSTGFVYLTTRKKVNEIHCKNLKVFLLSASEEEQIRHARATGVSSHTVSVKSPTPASVEQNLPAGESVSNAKPASIETQSPARNLWQSTTDFFKGLFQRTR